MGSKIITNIAVIAGLHLVGPALVCRWYAGVNLSGWLWILEVGCLVAHFAGRCGSVLSTVGVEILIPLTRMLLCVVSCTFFAN